MGGIPAGFLEGDEAELKVLRLLKECGAVLQVTVRKKEDSTSGVFRSWAFVTFAEAVSAPPQHAVIPPRRVDPM